MNKYEALIAYVNGLLVGLSLGLTLAPLAKPAPSPEKSLQEPKHVAVE